MRGDDDLLLLLDGGQDRGHEVGKALADAGAGLDDEMPGRSMARATAWAISSCWLRSSYAGSRRATAPPGPRIEAGSSCAMPSSPTVRGESPAGQPQFPPTMPCVGLEAVA